MGHCFSKLAHWSNLMHGGKLIVRVTGKLAKSDTKCNRRKMLQSACLRFWEKHIIFPTKPYCFQSIEPTVYCNSTIESTHRSIHLSQPRANVVCIRLRRQRQRGGAVVVPTSRQETEEADGAFGPVFMVGCLYFALGTACASGIFARLASLFRA